MINDYYVELMDINSDISILINSQIEYQVHRMILMKIPYFKSLLSRSNLFTDEIIYLDGMNIPEWNLLLKYLYTDISLDTLSLENTYDLIQMILLLDRFSDVERVNQISPYINWNILSLDNLIDLYHLESIKDIVTNAIGMNHSLLDIERIDPEIASNILHMYNRDYPDMEISNVSDLVEYLHSDSFKVDPNEFISDDVHLLGSLTNEKRLDIIRKGYEIVCNIGYYTNGIISHIQYSPSIQYIIYIFHKYREYLSLLWLFGNRLYAYVYLLDSFNLNEYERANIDHLQDMINIIEYRNEIRGKRAFLYIAHRYSDFDTLDGEFTTDTERRDIIPLIKYLEGLYPDQIEERVF